MFRVFAGVGGNFHNSIQITYTQTDLTQLYSTFPNLTTSLIQKKTLNMPP